MQPRPSIVDMRLASTRAPHWYGRDRTQSGLLAYVSAHRVLSHTDIPEHRSPAHKLAVVVAGSLSLRVGGRPLDLDGASWTVVPPNVPLVGGDGVSQGLFLWIGISPERDGEEGAQPLLAPSTRNALAGLLRAQYGVVRGLDSALLAACVEIFALVHAGADPVLIHGATLTLVGRLRAATVAGGDPRSVARERIAPALALAAAHPDGRVGIEALAGACRLGHSAFGAAWTAALGLSPRAWLNRERARGAARAVGAGGIPADVARHFGYPSARHLSRALLQFTGRGLRAWTDSAGG